MKRIVVITVLAALLLSTVGATVAVAKDNQPAGKSDIWQQSVTITNPDGSTGYGKFVLNVKQHTFTFAGEGCTPGVVYTISYTPTGGTLTTLASTPANADGTLRMSSPCSMTTSELASVVCNLPLKAILDNVKITPNGDGYIASIGPGVASLYSGGTGMLTYVEIAIVGFDSSGVERGDASAIIANNGDPLTPWQMLNAAASVGMANSASYTITLTVKDTAGTVASQSKTLSPPVG